MKDWEKYEESIWNKSHNITKGWKIKHFNLFLFHCAINIRLVKKLVIEHTQHNLKIAGCKNTGEQVSLLNEKGEIVKCGEINLAELLK